MVYSIQNYWVFGHFSSSGILRNRNTTFRKLDLFPSSGEGGGGEKTPTQLFPLERAHLNHWTTPVRFTQLFNPSVLYSVHSMPAVSVTRRRSTYVAHTV
jgi:hypothetical protein